MTTRTHLLEKIADLIADYREGEGIVRMDVAHVDRWVSQFHPDIQEPLLAELDHVLERTYIGRDEMRRAVSGIATDISLTGGNHAWFWRNAVVLAIQTKGNSQREMVELVDDALRRDCGASLYEEGSGPLGPYVYFDDFSFSGDTIANDIIRWIQQGAPQVADLVIYTLVCHSRGKGKALSDIKRAARFAGKDIHVSWLTRLEIEDRLPQAYNPDVLRPTAPPEEEVTQAYMAGVRQPMYRRPGQTGALGFYSSEEGRSLLEQCLLVAGAHVLDRCPKLNYRNMRPLGYDTWDSTGFGSMLVSYRNCPNNAPLALWAGHPWYPLFPRRTN